GSRRTKWKPFTNIVLKPSAQGDATASFMPKESCRPYRLARRLNFKVRSAGGLQNIFWSRLWPAASSALLKEWHRPRVWNLILCDWPRKVRSPNRTAVGALRSEEGRVGTACR